jgi:hypothetical protein
MLKFAKFSTVLSLVIPGCALLAATPASNRRPSRLSPLILVEMLLVVAALVWVLPQVVATLVLIWKRDEAGRWPFAGGGALLALLVGTYAACAIDSSTVLYAT